MTGPCLCGDLYCPSCGPAQGNYKCDECGTWQADLAEIEWINCPICMMSDTADFLEELLKSGVWHDPARYKRAEYLIKYLRQTVCSPGAK